MVLFLFAEAKINIEPEDKKEKILSKTNID
jgi:hypothetical protein